MKCACWIAAIFLTFPLFADDWNGTNYAQNSSVQAFQAKRLIDSVAFQGNETILDLGCGDGKITVQIATKVPQGLVIGIDPSSSMLKKAEEIKDVSNLTFKEGAAEDFSLSERFDHIFSSYVLHWVKDQDQALKNIYDHLKPGGKVHFIIATSKEGLPFHAALQKTCESWKADLTGFVNTRYFYDIETHRKFLVKAGFHIDGLHYVFRNATLENKEKFKTWIQQWLPESKYLSVYKQLGFMEELVDHYLEEMGLSPNTIEPIQWGEYLLIVEASKK
ncbi:MAG: methyltransferase domain-containing protein [Chlamydiae bacterium]|nr:methyltransferase domain-containing protein [Chlamydiota bacterium]